MADRRRIVTLNSSGVPTPLVDLERPDGGLTAATNLIINPKAEVNTTGASASGESGMTSIALSRESCDWHEGADWCYRVTGTQPADSTPRSVWVSLPGSHGSNRVPVTEGEPYTLSAYVRTIDESVATDRGYRVYMLWFDAGGSFLSASSMTHLDDGGVTDQRLTLTATPPASAASCAPQVRVTTITPGDVVTFEVTAAQMEAGSSAISYFDGDTAGCQWTGTPHASTSTRLTGQLVSVRDAFRVVPPPARPVLAQRHRRYGGARTVGETHENGMVATTLLVSGASTDACLSMVSDLLAVTQAARQDLFFEWRPDGASDSTFYEVRGPARWNPQYRWIEMAGAQVLRLDLEIPVAPLARLAPQTFTITSTDLPAVYASVTGVGGDAPALADVTLRTSGGTSPPIWALFAWWKRVTATPLAGSVAPVGILEAETATNLATWATEAAASARGGSRLNTATSGAGTASAEWVVDPSVLEPDDFAQGEIDIEVWARVVLASTVVSPRLTLSLIPDAGASFGQPTYTPEFGSAGRLVTVPTAGAYRRVRLGVLTMPVDPAQPLKWRVKLAASWATGSTGTSSFGVDYLELVPARARACSKSGVANDSYYPDFISSTSDTSKTIRSDLSGLVGSAAANKGRDSGLGGSLIEIPPGDTDFLLHLSSIVPDDPTSDATSEQLAHTGVTGSIVVTPRVHLAGVA